MSEPKYTSKFLYVARCLLSLFLSPLVLLFLVSQWWPALQEKVVTGFVNPYGSVKAARQHPHYKAHLIDIKMAELEVGKLIGTGKFSQVKLATRYYDNSKFALKDFDKAKVTRTKMFKYVVNERKHLLMLNHPGVIRLIQTFQDRMFVFILSEYAEGGELFDLIQKHPNGLRPALAAFYTAELVTVLEYLRPICLLHRDLKPENIFLTADRHLKVGDWGTSRLLSEAGRLEREPPPLPDPAHPNRPPKRRYSFVGTPEYMSPEVFHNNNISMACDLWSLGCILYQMMVGKLPFKGKSDYYTFQLADESHKNLSFPDWIDPTGKDLIQRLLSKDPQCRPGAGLGGFKELKSHPFFTDICWKNLHLQPVPTILPSLHDVLLLHPGPEQAGQWSQGKKAQLLLQVLDFLPLSGFPQFMLVSKYWAEFLVPRAYLRRGVF